MTKILTTIVEGLDELCFSLDDILPFYNCKNDFRRCPFLRLSMFIQNKFNFHCIHIKHLKLFLQSMTHEFI